MTGVPETGPRRRNRVRRKVAVATWRPSRDGRIYTRVEVDASAALAYCARLRDETGVRVTLTHVVGCALARALRDEPEIRARIVLGRVVPLAAVDIGFAVDIGTGSDLAPMKVAGVDRLAPVDVARELEAGAARLRAGEDRSHRRTSLIVRLAPTVAMRPVVAVAGLLAGGLGLPAFGQPGFPLGSAFVSNVGSLGLDEAFLAPLPLARTPIYLSVGAVRDRPVAEDGAVVVRPVVVLVATGDHRLVDGSHAARLTEIVRHGVTHPESLDHPGGSGSGAPQR